MMDQTLIRFTERATKGFAPIFIDGPVFARTRRGRLYYLLSKGSDVRQESICFRAR